MMLLPISITAVAKRARSSGDGWGNAAHSIPAQKRASNSCSAASDSGVARSSAVTSTSGSPPAWVTHESVASERLLGRRVGLQDTIERRQLQDRPRLLRRAREAQVAPRQPRGLQSADQAAQAGAIDEFHRV